MYRSSWVQYPPGALNGVLTLVVKLQGGVDYIDSIAKVIIG